MSTKTRKKKTVYSYYGLDRHEQELIAAACDHSPKVELAPLDKGLSGSKVLLARWTVSGTYTKFHVFKIGDASKLHREYKAITTIAAPLVPNFPNADYKISADKQRALLSQEFIGNDDGSTRSLRQYIEGALTAAEVAKIIEELYKSRSNWIPATPKVEHTTVGDHLMPWIRKGDLPKAVAEIGKSAVDASLKARPQLTQLDDLDKLIKKVFASTISIKTGPVHGDLHSQNVIVDRAKKVSFIDFGWTDVRWLAVDFLWLECSLKYVVAPQYAQLDDLLAIENVLDACWDTGIADTSDLTNRMVGNELARIATGISVIRKHAKQQDPSLSLRDYRKGLIAMTYALTTFPQLNRVHLIHSLARETAIVKDEIVDEGPYRQMYTGKALVWPGNPGRMVKKALTVQPTPGKALDIGCGDGKDIVHLEGANWHVTGVDINSRAIANVTTRARNQFGDTYTLKADISRANAVTHDFGSELYDLVVAYGLYHCLDDAEVAIVHAKAAAALKKGGLLAFAAFNDNLPLPADHPTGDIYLRPEDHIFKLAGDDFEVVDQEIGALKEKHANYVEHEHALTWALLRKR